MLTKDAIAVLIAVASLCISLSVGLSKQSAPLSGVALNQVFQHSTVTTSGVTLLKSNPGMVHAVVVASTSGGVIGLYDSASTTNYGGSEEVVALKSNVAEGVYTLDMILKNGLIVVSSSTPDAVVTFQ